MTNNEIAALLDELGTLCELDGVEPFKCAAYHKAAQSIAAQTAVLSTLPKLPKIPNVGPSIGSKLQEIIEKGTCSKLEELRSAYPRDALTLTRIPGIGPKTAYKWVAQYGIPSFDYLKELLAKYEAGESQEDELDALLEKWKDKIHFACREMSRIPYGVLLPRAKQVLEYIRANGNTIEARFAGSMRRKKETIKDVDILIKTKDAAKSLDCFVYLAEIGFENGTFTLVNRGERKASLLAKIEDVEFRIDLLVIDPESWGAALCYFTGSKDHNVELRSMAKEKGWTVNEYGIWDAEENKLGGAKERDLYKLLGIPFVPPEMRDLPRAWELVRGPKLVEADLKTAWHVHSNWSPDSETPILEMAHRAKLDGFTAITITDHSYSSWWGSPNNGHAIYSFKEECAAAQEAVGIRVIPGIEVDIALDGKLAMTKANLDQFEVVIAGVHMKHAVDLTARYLKAIESGFVTVIAHPTTRIFGQRPEGECDWDTVFAAAAKAGVAMEISCLPDRMDLPSDLVVRAQNAGCKFAIGLDAHHPQMFSLVKYGVGTANRAGLVASDLLEMPGLPEKKEP